MAQSQRRGTTSWARWVTASLMSSEPVITSVTWARNASRCGGGGEPDLGRCVPAHPRHRRAGGSGPVHRVEQSLTQLRNGDGDGAADDDAGGPLQQPGTRRVEVADRAAGIEE